MKKYLVILLLIFCVISAAPFAAFADPPEGEENGNTQPDPNPGIWVQVNVYGTLPDGQLILNGDNPDAWIYLNGDNPDVWINGYNLQDVISSGIGQAVSQAVQQATPNSTYSGASTGTIPPLAAIKPELQAIAPGKYTYSSPGWLGYFGVNTNITPYVYKGAGCGVWGVSDGYPDLWTRRQIAGFAPEFYLQKEKLNMSLIALSKLITESKGQDSAVSDLATQMQTGVQATADTALAVSVLEAENNQLHKQLEDKINSFNLMMICLASGIAVLLIAVIVLFVLFTKTKK